jgi:hypothetical protein
MDTLDKYRQCIKKLLLKRAQRIQPISDDTFEAQTLLDLENDHYQLMYVGWDNQRRIYGPVLHFDIKNGKIWIQWNGTEDDVAAELVELGVSPQDIVLGFHTPFMRQFTDYAVN